MTLPTAIEKLRQACQQVLEADQKATPRPWEHIIDDDKTPEHRLIRSAKNVVIRDADMTKNWGTDSEDFDMIALSRNLSPIMARVVLDFLENGYSEDLWPHQGAIIQAAESLSSLNGGKSR